MEPSGPPTLERLDRYLDAVPRNAARTEEIGPFTLFANEGDGWRYYARPRPGERGFRADDVRAVLARQSELGQPRSFEWIEDVSPGVARAATDAGLTITDRPLMLLGPDGRTTIDPPADVRIEALGPDDDVATAIAVAMIAFGEAGAEIGRDGLDRLPEVAASVDPRTVAFTRGRIAAGLTILMVARTGGRTVATGSHQPLDGVTEVTGIACLPAYRRRGIGAAVTAALVADAAAAGIGLICLSAGDEQIARMYERVGFRTIGRVGEASPRERGDGTPG